ncbi:MAG: NADPH-dependent F420 reductase [Bacteroidota bacterium]|jgi:predicted dinucleotide-binding enzyme|nr:NAD(P)-binding domain-containing protein [Flammeovirgaceae bacterium]MCZ8070047.1 NAD(P)-binding domain-containing protein [Cytophagales bacterium]
MNIAVLGTGSVGQALASKLVALGHTVKIGTRDVAASKGKTQPDGWGNPAIGSWLQANPAVELVTFAEAVSFSDGLIVHAMNGQAAIESLKSSNSKNLDGKILIDITNPLDFSKGMPPTLFVSNTESLAEQIQATFPTLKVVKTLNTMSNPVMVNPSLVPGNHTVFMSGNDTVAKNTVRQLLQSFGWADINIMDLGDISTARGTEMILPLWLRVWGKVQTPFFNFAIHVAQK